MARQRKEHGNKGSSSNNSGYKARRDWQKTLFYVFSLLVVLSMICGLFASIFRAI